MTSPEATNNDLDTSFIQDRSQQIRELEKLSREFGRALNGAFADGIAKGNSFGKVLESLKQSFIEFSLKAALKPIELLFSSTLNSLLQGTLGRAAPFTLQNLGTSLFGGGATGAPLSITPFAEGGVIGAPSFFPLGRNLGLAGERGAEAILPLARGPDGRLGVTGTGRTAAPVAVNVTIQTPDAESFARSEAQVAAALARAVARGRRGL